MRVLQPVNVKETKPVNTKTNKDYSSLSYVSQPQSYFSRSVRT